MRASMLMKETAEAIDPDDSSKEMGRRHIELGILKREPYGPDLCVLGMKPLRSPRSMPSEFRWLTPVRRTQPRL
jgi:hypothetical protein